MPRINNRIPIAAGEKHPFDLSFSHATTMDFMLLQPVAYRHCVDDENLDMTAFATVRPAPMQVPCFGRCHLSLRSYFVPYELVFPNWHAFKQDVIASNYTSSSIVSNVPYFSIEELWQSFLAHSLVTQLPVGSTDGDFCDENGNYFVLTSIGRHHYKILTSLGYRLIIPKKGSSPFYFNALGLLALAKVYVDWYANKNYLNSVDVLGIERLLKFNDPASALALSRNDIYNILSFCAVVCYDNESYFLDSWDNPLGPVSGQFSSLQFLDPTSSNGTYVSTNTNGTPEMYQNSDQAVSVGTQYAHDALKRLSDYQRRHALSSAHQIERFLSEAGYVPESLKLTRSVYIGHQNVDINFGDIYATADSQNASGSSSVGDFAGRGFGQGNKNWSFHCDQQGVFLVLASIIPDSSFVQGYDRNNRLMTKQDFFTSSFDGLSTQVLEKGEVYVSRNCQFASSPSDYAGKYSFVGRYGEKKRPLNFLTGDFALPYHYLGGSSWTMARLFDDSSFTNISGVVHSLDITRGRDAYLLDRIFDNTSIEFDHFYVFLDFDFHTQSRMKPLFETYEFDEESSKYITIGSGPKVN